jgi:hypothetical protein
MFFVFKKLGKSHNKFSKSYCLISFLVMSIISLVSIKINIAYFYNPDIIPLSLFQYINISQIFNSTGYVVSIFDKLGDKFNFLFSALFFLVENVIKCLAFTRGTQKAHRDSALIGKESCN